jgi:hypothetical protein
MVTVVFDAIRPAERCGCPPQPSSAHPVRNHADEPCTRLRRTLRIDDSTIMRMAIRPTRRIGKAWVLPPQHRPTTRLTSQRINGRRIPRHSRKLENFGFRKPQRLNALRSNLRPISTQRKCRHHDTTVESLIRDEPASRRDGHEGGHRGGDRRWPSHPSQVHALPGSGLHAGREVSPARA